ncbi:hypothetical protein A3Q56_00585 [Intoshia linei]|uniref:DH domain-containing protein n=1 Tax=Intoshia linei TaxID=1819745 RepID=A0A177BDG7_9BILA|nr:hypothetical protein A3Q56_00585 [Intoshia linei]
MNENLQNSTVHGIKKVLNASGLTLSLSDANLSLISQLILDSFTGLNSSCVIQCKWHIVDFLESSHVKEKLIQSIFNVDIFFNELRKLLDKYLQYSNDGPTITSNLIEKLSQTLHCALSSKTLKKSDDIIKSKKQYLGFKKFKMSKIFRNDKLKTPKISNYYPSVQSSTYIMYSTNSMSYDYKSHLNFCKTCQKIRKFLIDEKNYVNSIQSIIILFRNVVFKSIESKMLADLIDKLDGCLELSVYIINMLEDESELQQGECRIPNFVNFFNQLCEIREFDVFIRYYELLDTCDWIREIHYYSNSYFYQLENDIDGLSTSLCRNYVYYFVLPLDRLEKYGNIFESIKTQNHSVPNDKIDSPFIHMKILIDNISNSQQNKQLKDITNGSAFINQINRFDSNSGPIYEGNLAIVEISKLKIAECYCCIDLNGNFYLYRINEKANLMPFKFKGIKKQTITLNLHKVVLQDYPNLSG